MPRPVPRSTRLAMALTAALCLATSGCGSGSSPTPSTTTPVTSTTTPTTHTTPAETRTASDASFYIYRDVDYQGNHFKPTGFMGDVGDVVMDEASTVEPHSGTTALRFRYSPEGRGPNECSYSPPCKWAGVYWLEPPNNWGRDPEFQDQGFDLSEYSRLVFSAKASKDISITFKVGGIVADYGDSLEYPRTTTAEVTNEWKQYEIDLSGAELSHIIGGFVWTLDWQELEQRNYQEIEFYLDDVRFEH